MHQARIVFRGEDGRIIPADKLTEVNGRVRYEIVSDQEVPAKAQALHQEGWAAGQRGDYKEALKLFDQAHRLAADWPYPLYDAAFAHLLNGDAANAERLYREVDRMAPWGFFTAKVALDSLRREREGTLEKGTYRMLVLLEGEPSAEKGRSLLEAVLQRTPAFPAGWHALANALEHPSERLQGIEQGLKHNPDPSTKGALLLNKAMVLSVQGQRDQAVGILDSIIRDRTTTLGNLALAQVVLATLQRTERATGE